MQPPFPIYRWGRDNAEIARLIRLAPSQLQLILKTRNEVQLLEKWLEHHCALLDQGARIIVLDHMSTQDAVFDIYARFAERLLLVRYDGHVDSAHSLARFGELYQALWASSAFYALLDTDEFLYLFDGLKLVKDQRILSYLQANAGAAFFPSLRLDNLLGREDAFAFSEATARHLHLCGKPVINSAMAEKQLKKPVGHNFDLPVALFENTPLALVLLHLTTWPMERRIRANMQKLANFGVIEHEKDFQAVMKLDTTSLEPEYIRNYVHEVRLLADAEAAKRAAAAALGEDHVLFSASGKPGFFPENLKEIFKKHVNRGTDFLAALGIERQSLGLGMDLGLGMADQSLDAALKKLEAAALASGGRELDAQGLRPWTPPGA